MNKQFETTPAWGDRVLLDFLKGKLPEEEQKLITSELEQNPFLKDAVEGLKNMEDEQAIRDSVQLLQKQLKHLVQRRKSRRNTFLKPKLWLWVAVLSLLLLIFIAWWAMTFFIH